MKIIRISNYDHEDERGNQRVVASNITIGKEARIMAAALNAAVGIHSEDYFDVVDDDYALHPDYAP